MKGHTLLLLLVAAIGWGGWLSAAPQPLAVEWLSTDRGRALEVSGGLVRYRFTELGGALQSAYVYFSTYRSQPLDAVPGWTLVDRKLALAPGVSLPFEIWVGDAQSDSHLYTLEVSHADEATATVSMSGGIGGLRAEKEFTLRTDALYTMGVRLRISGQGERVRVVVGHRPSGKGAPELLFLYDDRVYASPLAPGTYSRFQGLGLVGKQSVFFLRLDEGSGLVPFLGVNAAGQPVFGLEGSGNVSFRGVLYAGRNRYLLLDKAGLGMLVDLSFFSRFLVMVMRFFEWLYQLTGNYGWAIILFTLITRVLLYPLMRNQLRSMAKMQRLAPKLKKLQEKYKDDRETLHKQMMELYRAERVNPLGGCLPLILQMPLLILLWQAIMYSAEQIHLSPGFLWIRDLSQPDPYYILVILTTGLMLFQQWLTQRRLPEPPTGGGQAMGWLFPVIMAVFFLSFPAGLWLYWFLSTALQMGQQLVVDWELARERARPVPPPPEDEPAGD